MANRAVDNYVYERVRNFLRQRHKMQSRGGTQFSGATVFGKLGVLSSHGWKATESPPVIRSTSYSVPGDAVFGCITAAQLSSARPSLRKFKLGGGREAHSPPSHAHSIRENRL